MKSWTPKNTLIVAGVAVVALWYLKNRTVETAKAVGQAVNPINHDNIFNQGAEGIYGAITGSNGSPGTDLADWVHDGDRWWN